jgi:hypothetical protein
MQPVFSADVVLAQRAAVRTYLNLRKCHSGQAGSHPLEAQRVGGLRGVAAALQLPAAAGSTGRAPNQVAGAAPAARGVPRLGGPGPESAPGRCQGER